MVYRLWEKMHQDPSFKLPPGTTPDSDLARLWGADKKSILGVVHELAQNHGFYQPDGKSVLITPHSHLSLREGMLHFSDSAHADTVQAPEHAPTTPAYTPGAEIPRKPTESDLLNEQSWLRHASDGPGATHAADAASTAPAHSATEATPSHTAPSPEPPPVATGHPTAFENHFRVFVDPTQGHVYTDQNGAFMAYGNNFQDRLRVAKAYALSQRRVGFTVWVQAERPILYNGAWRPWAFPVTYRGILRGVQVLDSSTNVNAFQIGAVDPERFTKLLY
jgi:hypothetical protein